MFNHLEYDTASLGDEYGRDVKAGSRSRCRATTSPATIRTRTPENRWRSHAHLLFQNWINEIYQTTPFELGDIGR